MRRRRLRLVTFILAGLLVGNAFVTATARADAGTASVSPAQQATLDRVRQQATADTQQANAPRYDGKALLPQVPPAVSAPTTTAEKCFKPQNKPSGTALKHYEMCISPDPVPAKVEPGPGGKGMRVNGVPRATPDSVIPLPDDCYQDVNLARWVYQRKLACSVRPITGVVVDEATGEPIGTIKYDQLDLQATSPSDSIWTRQLLLMITGGTLPGVVPGITVGGAAGCSELSPSCSLVVSSFPPQPVEPGSYALGQAAFSTTISDPGSTGTASTVFAYIFAGPDWLPIPVVADPPAPVRCDKALPNNSTIGCVYPNVTPVQQYSLDGEFPELARHISDAQKSGLPGGYPDGPALTRLTNADLQDRNRNQACRPAANGGYPRPPTKSCDEYPMASTYQGAYVSNPANPGPVRTFDWCDIEAPRGTGPTGYSVCMIDARQNSVGGSDLNETYLNNRIIDGDEFYVQISGIGGGPNPNPPDYPPVVDAGPDVSGFEGDHVALHGTATDDYGPLSIGWSYSAGPDVDPGTVCFFGDATKADTTIRCTDDGTFTVTLRASDPYHDDPSVDTATVHLANVAPQIRRNTGDVRTRSASAQADPVLGITAPSRGSSSGSATR